MSGRLEARIMRQLLIVTATFVALISSCFVTVAEDESLKPVEIPLKAIWAIDMPGTHPIRSSGLPGEFVPEAPLVKEIRESLRMRAPYREDDPAGEGFAVVGSGMDALRRAHGILAKHRRPLRVYPDDRDISAVFFSRSSGSYVQIQKVERQGNDVTIRYKFVPHEEQILSSHLAIIPLGHLPVGVTTVKVARDDGDALEISEDQVARVVCESFSIEVSPNIPSAGDH
jgi:hypothetical protein